FAGAGHHHGFGSAAEPVGGFVAEVFDDDFGVGGQGGGVEVGEPGDFGACPVGVDFDVLGAVFGHFPVGLVGDVVRQHVEDEFFFDGLAHRVDVEGAVEAGVRVGDAEQLQRFVFGGGGEREVRQVGVLSARHGGRGQRVAVVVAGLLGPHSAQHFFQFGDGLAGLAGVRFVDDHRDPFVVQRGDAFQHVREGLHGDDDDFAGGVGQRLGDFGGFRPAGSGDFLDDAGGVVELVDGVL